MFKLFLRISYRYFSGLETRDFKTREITEKNMRDEGQEARNKRQEMGRGKGETGDWSAETRDGAMILQIPLDRDKIQEAVNMKIEKRRQKARDKMKRKERRH
jgi:hypothetical protein